MPSTLRAYAVVLPVVILGLVAPAISAAQIETNLTLEVTSVHAQLTNLVVGDRYDLSFTLDDAT